MVRHQILFVLCFGTLIVGCASTQTNIVVNDNGTYSAVASSYSTSKAYKAALEAASSYCRKMGKKIVNVNESKSGTVSSDQEPEGDRSPAAGGVSFEKDKHPGTAKTTDESKVTLDFRCV